jgi:hypothetical protein
MLCNYMNYMVYYMNYMFHYMLLCPIISGTGLTSIWPVRNFAVMLVLSTSTVECQKGYCFIKTGRLEIHSSNPH